MKNSKLLMVMSVVLSCSFAAVAADEAKGPVGPMRGACKDDVAKLCQGIQPGGGRIAACLKAHKDQVSDACKAAVKDAHAHRKGGKPDNAAGEKGE